MIGHGLMGTSLVLTATDVAQGRAHCERALALYNAAEHRALAARFGQDVRVTNLAYRSLALWVMGYPEAALADLNQAISDARDTGEAATLMFALGHAPLTLLWTGNYVAAATAIEEVVALSGEKDAFVWNVIGKLHQGCLFALTGRAAEAVQVISSGVPAWRSIGSKLWMPNCLSYLATAYAEIGQFDDAWRCIGEAMTAVETTKEGLWEAEVNRMAGEIASEIAPSRMPRRRKTYFERALASRPPTTSQILGTPRRHEPRTPLARPGQGAASARTVCSGLRVVHGGLRHARSEGGEGITSLTLITVVTDAPRGYSIFDSNTVAPPVAKFGMSSTIFFHSGVAAICCK